MNGHKKKESWYFVRRGGAYYYSEGCVSDRRGDVHGEHYLSTGFRATLYIK